MQSQFGSGRLYAFSGLVGQRAHLYAIVVANVHKLAHAGCYIRVGRIWFTRCVCL